MSGRRHNQRTTPHSARGRVWSPVTSGVMPSDHFEDAVEFEIDGVRFVSGFVDCAAENRFTLMKPASLVERYGACCASSSDPAWSSSASEAACRTSPNARAQASWSAGILRAGGGRRGAYERAAPERRAHPQHDRQAPRSTPSTAAEAMGTGRRSKSTCSSRPNRADNGGGYSSTAVVQVCTVKPTAAKCSCQSARPR
jgi:hypothetical protein